MAITFNCSQCGKTVRIGDEYAGRKGRCPNCLAVIDIPRAEPAGSVLTPPEQGEQPYGARLGEDYAGPALSPSWSTVRSGLTVTYVGILITFFGALFLFLLLLGGGRPAAGLLALVGLIGLVVIVGVVMNIVGVGMCGAAPTESGGKGLAVAAAVLMVISLLTGIGLAVAESVQDQKAVRPLPGQPGLPNQPAQTEPALLMLNLVVSILGLAGQLCFYLFLRKTAQFFGNERLARSVTSFLIFWFSVVGGAILLACLMVRVPPGGIELLVLLLGVGLLVCAVVAFFWSLSLIQRTRDTIAKALKAIPAPGSSVAG